MNTQAGLVTRRQALRAGLEERLVDALVRSGEWTAVRRGVYVETQHWKTLTAPQQSLLRDRAASLHMQVRHVFSHDSAARALDLAMLRSRVELSHITRPGVLGSRTRHGVKHHLAPYPPSQVVLTAAGPALDPARTACDVAREHGQLAGVVTMDAARHAGTSVDALWQAVTAMRCWPGVTAVRAAITESRAGAESAGETLLRRAVIELGIGEPELQFGLTDGVRTAFCDLRVGRHLFEFDGQVKYRGVEHGGLAVVSAEDVVWEEKKRQDWLTGFHLGISRVIWAELWGEEARARTRERLRREHDATARRLGTSIDDLERFRVRRRPRSA